MAHDNRSAHNCQPDHWARLAAWYATPLGQALQASEKACLDGVLAQLFGYHLLQVGRPCTVDLLSASRVSHCMIMDLPPAIPDGRSGELVGLPHALPFAAASLDVVVLPHILEFSPWPHEVLREVERVLIPEGSVVLLGFNPWSSWVSKRLLLGWRKRVPWCGRFRTQARIRDWLSLLGFDIDPASSCFYRPPVAHPGILSRLGWMDGLGRRLWRPFGASYIMVARKRVATLTPVRPRWRPRRKLVAPGLVEPYQQSVRTKRKERGFE